ncbi:hypothetical protein [Luteipulveratus halotolerans]|uniref:Uncharacterized protein n=1 Tax=Luteipulveratus halotolerans TaxID=1631356 RepID=A0A0L6CI40_9MICO|nr:hypothetical protein [Luteipulveratus halotolerans]KNX37446.1 hypothetical protein VV01_10305 [Luteipulveratus halotolerans]
MRRLVLASACALGIAVTGAAPAMAGSPHFIKSATSASASGDTLTVSGKEAGLGDEDQVHIVLNATALCINNGGHHPKAVNKADVTGAGDFPVQNAKADFTLSATASFQPDCSSPMTVAFTGITVTDTTNGISLSVPGTLP